MKYVQFPQPDKESSTVIKRKLDHLDKMENIPRDRRRFLPDNNLLIEKEISGQLQIPLVDSFISEVKKLKSIGIKTPRLKGSPKTHI